MAAARSQTGELWQKDPEESGPVDAMPKSSQQVSRQSSTTYRLTASSKFSFFDSEMIRMLHCHTDILRLLLFVCLFVS